MLHFLCVKWLYQDKDIDMAVLMSCENTQNKINTEWCKQNEGEKQGQKYSNLSCLVIFFFACLAQQTEWIQELTEQNLLYKKYLQ